MIVDLALDLSKSLRTEDILSILAAQIEAAGAVRLPGDLCAGTNPC